MFDILLLEWIYGFNVVYL